MNKNVWNKFKNNKRAIFGLVIILLEIIIMIFIPIIFKLDPYTIDTEAGFLASPTSSHLLGTDGAGRDLLARVLYGGRVSLIVGLISPIISVAIGLPLGLIAGYYRGWAETIINRLSDIFMSFPSMILILILVAVLGPSIITVIGVIGVLGWTSIAKLVYGNVLSIRKKEYIEAAITMGKSDFDLLFKEILPNAIAPVWVSLSFRIGGAILTESALSFLGVGIQPPNASWGNIMTSAQNLAILTTKPWVWIPSGFLIILTVIAFNFIGEGLRDALDPKMKI